METNRWNYPWPQCLGSGEIQHDNTKATSPATCTNIGAGETGGADMKGEGALTSSCIGHTSFLMLACFPCGVNCIEN